MFSRDNNPSPHCSNFKNIGKSPAHCWMLLTMTNQEHSNAQLTFLTACLGSQNIICLSYQTRYVCKLWHMQQLNCTQSFEGAEQGTARTGCRQARAQGSPSTAHTTVHEAQSHRDWAHHVPGVSDRSTSCPRHKRDLSQEQKRWFKARLQLSPKSILPAWPRAGLETSYNICLESIQEAHYSEACLKPMQETELEKQISLTQLRHRLRSQAQV